MRKNKKKNVKLVYVCSGAADVGELTDLAARKMTRDGVAEMSCLAGIGARDDDIMFNAEMADRVLLIDGCPKACARRTFERANLRRYKQFDLSQVKFFKGSSPPTQENIQRVTRKAITMLEGESGPGLRTPAAPPSAHPQPFDLGA